MSLPSINFLHHTVSEIHPGQGFIGQGHYGKVKGHIKVTPWRCTPTPPDQSPYQVSTNYTLWFPRYSSDKILKVKVTTARDKITVVKVNTARPKVKSRSDHDVAHLHPLTNVPIKYKLPTPYSFWDTAWTNFFPPPAHPSGDHGWKQEPKSP